MTQPIDGRRRTGFTRPDEFAERNQRESAIRRRLHGLRIDTQCVVKRLHGFREMVGIQENQAQNPIRADIQRIEDHGTLRLCNGGFAAPNLREEARGHCQDP